MQEKNSEPLQHKFYYDHRKLGKLLVFNLVALSILIIWGRYIFSPLMPLGLLVVFLWFLATLASAHVYFFPQNLAIITDNGIKIDHCATLKWEDILEAEEKTSSNRHFIIFKINKDFKYKKTFMQHICCHTRYTAFSVPLYAMNILDQEEIKSLIAQYTTYKEKK